MMNKMSVAKLKLIVAASENMCIGHNNNLPWRLKQEMAYFKRLTMHVVNANKRNAVIMGRRTWESIPEKNRPLAGRLNVVLTRNTDYLNDNKSNDLLIYNDFDSAVESLRKKDDLENIWVIGGADIYKIALSHPNCYRIYLTQILKHYDGDTFLPKISDDFEMLEDYGDESNLVSKEKQIEDGVEYYYKIYEKRN